MNIRLSAASATSGLTKAQIALIAGGIVALVTGAMIPLVSLARGETHKSATGQTVSADEAKLLAKSDEQRARSAAQALKLRQQDVGQGLQFDANGDLRGAPTDNAGDLPQNRHFDDATDLHAVAGRLPPATKAAYPASVAIQRGIESEEPAGGGDLGGGSTRAAEREGQGAPEAEDRTERAQPMLGYSMVPGATWAARRPQGQTGADGRAPTATTPPGEPGSAHADAVMERMAKAVEDSVRQAEGAKPDGDRGAGSNTAAASGAGGLWTSGGTGPSDAGEAPSPAERRTPAEVKPQGMVPGGLGDMRIGGTVGPDQVVRQGKFLDCAVVNEIRADLVESPVIAMVARDFVTLDGKYVLIPAGSKLLGEAGRVQNLQQERVYIKFDRVLFPDQRSAYFPVRKVPAVDGMGAVGVAGDVDRHFMLQFGAAVMLGVLDGIAAAAQSPSAAANPTVRDLVTARTSANFSTVLAGVIGRYANVVPTVTVPAGSKLKVFFSEDVRLSPYMPTAELSWVSGSGGAP